MTSESRHPSYMSCPHNICMTGLGINRTIMPRQHENHPAKDAAHKGSHRNRDRDSNTHRTNDRNRTRNRDHTTARNTNGNRRHDPDGLDSVAFRVTLPGPKTGSSQRTQKRAERRHRGATKAARRNAPRFNRSSAFDTALDDDELCRQLGQAVLDTLQRKPALLNALLRFFSEPSSEEEEEDGEVDTSFGHQRTDFGRRRRRDDDEDDDLSDPRPRGRRRVTFVN